MRLSPSPDLVSSRALTVAALVVTLAAGLLLATQNGHIANALGDSDDAMRLVLSRDLLGGRGWYDQNLLRLQPPVGVYMHWSPLISGGLAIMMWLFSQMTTAPTAELITRFLWPLLWIFPAVFCTLAASRRIGPPGAIFVTAVLLLLLRPALYAQFLPGRIDHHNIQIVLAVAAFAAAIGRAAPTRSAAVCGALSGLGMAIGLEALAFHALIGASFAARLAGDRRQAAPAMAYGLTLAAATAGLFAIQTPPARWSLSFCDAIGVNLVLAVGAAGCGLALVSTAVSRVGAGLRVGLVGGVGLAAAVAWLVADPRCLHGPFEAVDRRVWQFWLKGVQEIQPWWVTIVTERQETIREIVVAVMALAAAVFLAVRSWRQRDGAVWLALSLIVVAVIANAEAIRMQSYVAWFGAPVLASAFASLTPPRARGLLLPTLGGALVLSPMSIAWAINSAADRVAAKSFGGIPPAASNCLQTVNFRRLARLPTGLVLAEIDLGPFILAETKDAVLAAPYHRMSWGILAAHEIFDAPPAAAEGMTRRLHVTYVVDCPTYPATILPGSFADTLHRGAPSWLEPLSASDERIQIYRVRPLGRSS